MPSISQRREATGAPKGLDHGEAGRGTRSAAAPAGRCARPGVAAVTTSGRGPRVKSLRGAGGRQTTRCIDCSLRGSAA
jgi:hypothetical protein